MPDIPNTLSTKFVRGTTMSANASVYNKITTTFSRFTATSTQGSRRSVRLRVWR
jgi:hypothetical protein